MRSTETLYRRKGGFSLVELIIAVAVMALLGTVILRVFMSAGGMNKRAANLDKAVNLSVDAVERMKAENVTIVWNPETLKRVFPDSTIDGLDDGWRIRMLFDGEWQLFSSVKSDWPSHVMVIDLRPDPDTETATTSVIVTVSDTEASSGIPFRENGTETRINTIYTLQAELPSVCAKQEVAP